MVGIEPPSLQRDEVEALAGVDSERSVRWWRAMGFPEVTPGEIAFGTEDVDIVRRLDTMIAAGAMSDDDVARLARLMGASFSRQPFSSTVKRAPEKAVMPELRLVPE